MTSEEREKLFQLVLDTLDSTEESEAALRDLKSDARSETFNRAMEWSMSVDPRKRMLAVEILGSLYRRIESPRLEFEYPFRHESSSRISEMVRTEEDPDVLLTAIYAFSRLQLEAGIPFIKRFCRHPDAAFRLAVAQALGSFPNHPAAIPTLCDLCSDPDSSVRDWAVFGLGVQGDADSPEIRVIFLESLGDEDEDVREEAAAALAKRQDVRVLPSLWAMLEGPGINTRIAEASAHMLGFERDRKEWTEDDYREALRDKFGDLTSASHGE